MYMFKEHHSRTTTFVHFYAFFRKFWDLSQIIRLKHILTQIWIFFLFFFRKFWYLSHIHTTQPTRFSHTHIYIYISEWDYKHIYTSEWDRSIDHSFEEASSHTQIKKKENENVHIEKEKKKNVNRWKKNDAVRFFKGTTSRKTNIFFLNLTHHNNTVGTRKTSDCKIEFRCELQRFVFILMYDPFSVSRTSRASSKTQVSSLAWTDLWTL